MNALTGAIAEIGSDRQDGLGARRMSLGQA
jgi:hypothetical protein